MLSEGIIIKYIKETMSCLIKEQIMEETTQDIRVKPRTPHKHTVMKEYFVLRA